MHVGHPRFRGLIFDNGDILFDASLWRRWLHTEIEALDIKVTFDELVAHWESELVDVYQGKAAYWDRFDKLLGRLKVPTASRTMLTDAAKQKAKAVQTDRLPMPGVPETLAQLRQQGVKLAVLSDTEGGEVAVRGILQQLGVEDFFDSVIASSDIGYSKPAPEAYASAVKSLALSHDQCAFVAHDVDELTGAQDVGLFAIAYNDTPSAPRDATVEHFSELLKFAQA